MVKKRVGGGQRYANKGGSEAAKEQQKAKPGPAPPKHLQRKIAKKVGFLDKVAASSAALKVKAGVEKKSSRKPSALLTLTNTLGGVLDEIQGDVQRAAEVSKVSKGNKGQGKEAFGRGVKSSKARSVVQATEAARLQQVLHHPVFQQDPITAITNHLRNTLPDAPAPGPPGSKGKAVAGGPGAISRRERKKAARQRKREQASLMDDS